MLLTSGCAGRSRSGALGKIRDGQEYGGQPRARLTCALMVSDKLRGWHVEGSIPSSEFPSTKSVSRWPAIGVRLGCVALIWMGPCSGSQYWTTVR